MKCCVGRGSRVTGKVFWRLNERRQHARGEGEKARYLAVPSLNHQCRPVQGLLAVGNGQAACEVMVVWAEGVATDGALAVGFFAAFFATGFFAAFLAAGFFAAGFAATFFATFFGAAVLVTAVFLALAFFAAGF